MVKKIIGFVFLLLIAIQFVKSQKNIDLSVQKNALATKYPVPDTIVSILKLACNDCHTNNTLYPWYNHIQPVAWWLNNHIEEGKSRLNFDEFISYSLKRQDHKLQQIVDTQADHWMPLASYTWIHKNADLSAGQRKLLVNWVNGLRMQIQNNPDFQK